ncbi:FkbM family methyltransferase [Ruegeria sp. HKCCA4008]|uniref:FkbM family methyltransferase n=1 Tax=Ruegeria sp. HKCCA4008 TaxID=2682999 RepID=UPI00148847AA|nr:FkbM family methyltransferase [Ruegeria sp. HKCCA4008]
MASQREPYDVEVFGGQKCRLYPSDNWAERRVITGSQFFDLDERQSLANHMSQGSGDYAFVDAGANVGLYTLWVRSVAQKLGRNLKALVVEPDPVNKARLGTNLVANQASEVIHCDKALSDKPGEVWFESANLGDRGHAKVAESGDLCVQAIPLLDAIRDAGLTKVDAMKNRYRRSGNPRIARFFRRRTARDLARSAADRNQAFGRRAGRGLE